MKKFILLFNFFIPLLSFGSGYQDCRSFIEINARNRFDNAGVINTCKNAGEGFKDCAELAQSANYYDSIGVLNVCLRAGVGFKDCAKHAQSTTGYNVTSIIQLCIN